MDNKIDMCKSCNIELNVIKVENGVMEFQCPKCKEKKKVKLEDIK